MPMRSLIQALLFSAVLFCPWLAQAQDTTPVAMLVHGLNTRPDKMQTIANLLQGLGYHTETVALAGHYPGSSMDDVTSGEWHQELLEAYKKLIQSRSPSHILYVGYSLGGALGPEVFATEPDVHFDQMLLLAPAIAVHFYSRWIRVLGEFPSLRIPSMNLPEYRVNSFTTEAAYGALFQIVDNLHALTPDQAAKLNVPTLMFLDPSDELVSQSGLRDFESQYQIQNWRLQLVTNAGTTLPSSYHHLIIDSACVGQTQWDAMVKMMTVFAQLKP